MDEEDYTKLAIEDACVHKMWKARLIGYESAAKHFREIEDEKSSEWNKYIGLVKKFVIDSHALCQEKGLEAVLLFVENFANAGCTTRDVVSGIIQKCLAAPKTRTRELAVQIILMYIEIEKYEIVFDELIKGMESKNPKVVAACVNVLAQSLKEFGCNIINVSKLMMCIPSLLEDRDSNVRSETKMLVGVIYNWLGPAIKPKLTSLLKPAHLVDVEIEYEKVKNTTAKVIRLLRSQQNKKSAPSETEDEDVKIGFAVDEADKYDLLEPVDVLRQLDKDFYSKLESKKWSERKEVLEDLQKLLTATLKLELTDYSEMIRALKNIITKDSNVVVVGIAIKCVTALANGLKKNFHQYVPLIISTLFEKFKEKKQNIIIALREAVDAVYSTTNLETIQEEIIANLDNKNPSVKSEISGFLSRCFSKSTPNNLNKKLLKVLCKGLTNGLRNQDPSVRDNSALALGTAMKTVGDKTIGPYLVEIDSLILKKIKECCDKAEISVKQPNQKLKNDPKTNSEETKEEKEYYQNTVKTISEKPQMVESFEKPINPGNSQAYKEKNNGCEIVNEILNKNNQVLDNNPKVDISYLITDQLIAELGDKDWMIRAKAIEKLQGFVKSAGSINSNLGEAAPVIVARISDSNSKISASAIALVESLASAMGPPFKQYIRTFVPSLMKAIGDPKTWIRSVVISCLNTWGEVCGFKEFFEGEIIAEALRAGSTSVRSELWAWLAKKLPTIPTNRIKKDELTACLPILYSNLEDRNVDVRKNANDAILGFMLHLGFTNMIRACENSKGSGSNLVKLILEKTRGSLPVQPMVQIQSTDTSADKSNHHSNAKQSPGSFASSTKSKDKSNIAASKLSKNENNGDPLLQINSLKTQRIIDEKKFKTLRWNFVTPKGEFFDLLREQMTVAKVNKVLVAHMFHNDFRYHIRAIDALIADLPSNKEGLISNLDLILRWMTLRFFDTNPSVLLKELEYLNSLFNVLIEEEYSMMDTEASSFLPYLILKIGNPKDTIRHSVHAILKKVSAVYPVSKQFVYITEGLKSKNARQRSECLEQLGWLIENYGVSVCNPSPAGALKVIAKQISDRDTLVRNAALNCIVTAYFLEGEKTLQWVGPISEKNLPLLEERIKRAEKSRSLKTVKAVDSVKEDTMKEQGQLKYEAETSGDCDIQHLLIPNNTKEQPQDRKEIFMGCDTSNSFISTSQKSLSINGAFGFDQNIINQIECSRAHFQAPKLVDIDLRFLKDQTQLTSFKHTQMPAITPLPSNYLQPAAIIHELLNIDTSDIERAMTAISRIDIILNSHKWHNLIEFVDLIVSQLLYLIMILNQSEHPEVINCYTANLSLFTKLCNQPELCSQISEGILYKALEQLLYLLTKSRLEILDEQNMIVTDVNNLVSKLLENSNKTYVLCALLKILFSTINNQQATNDYNKLVAEWINILNKTQEEWDSKLDYFKILNEFHIFLNDYPTSFWKNNKSDFPLRTVITILQTMVRTRGTEVREIFERIPNVSKDSELYNYIQKAIEHLELDYSKDLPYSKDNQLKNIIHPGPRVSKENLIELSKIFQMIGDFERTTQGIKMLFAFKKSHPDADVQTFLSKSTPQFQQYIMQGLQSLEQQQLELSHYKENVNKDNESKQAKGEQFTKEAKFLWNRLKWLKEKLGFQVENNKEEVTDRFKEIPNVVIGIDIK